jgi:hypothetical protein
MGGLSGHGLPWGCWKTYMTDKLQLNPLTMCTATSRRYWRYIPQFSPKSSIYFLFQKKWTDALSSLAAFLRVLNHLEAGSPEARASEARASANPSSYTAGHLTTSTVSQPFVALLAHVGLWYVLGNDTPDRVFKNIQTLILLTHNYYFICGIEPVAGIDSCIRWGHLLNLHSQALIRKRSLISPNQTCTPTKRLNHHHYMLWK